MSKAIPRWMMKKFLNRNVTLEKVTETEIEYSGTVDPYGMTEVTKETFTVRAEIQYVTMEDLQFMPPGILTIGDAIGYFLTYYDLEGQIITIDPNDIIKDGDNILRVDTILDHTHGKADVYRRAYLRRMSGGGS